MSAQEPLPGDDFVTVTVEKDSDIEKVAFPSNSGPIPTFSAAFGRGAEVPPPSQMQFASRAPGPRSRSFSSDMYPDAQPISGLSPVHYRSPSAASSVSQNGVPAPVRALVRQGSSDSHSSAASSVRSGRSRPTSGSSAASGESAGRSRWVIE